jgi:N-acetylglucosamine-6-phosphate deacetylase
MPEMMCIGRDASSGAPVAVRFQDTISSVNAAPAGTVPADDVYVAPGWIDIQVNGFAGVDYNRPDTPLEEIARSIQALFATGVTRFYPTVITGAPQQMELSLRNLARARETLEDGEAIEGFHVEGPHISPEDGPRGAHPRAWVRPPDLDEFRRWQDAAGGRVRMVTLSPEWPDAVQYIEKITAMGVVAAIGHTQASAAQIAGAVSAGASISTHLGNGAHAVMRRHPNYIWEQLADDRLMAGFIGDGIHLGASFLKVALRAKGVDRAVLVTDATIAAGARPGKYKFGELAVELTADERVVLEGTDKLAGSALHMERGVANLMNLAGLTLADAIRMATTNPARAGKISGRERGLVPGERADLVQFRCAGAGKREGPCRIEILSTWMSGRQVYPSSASTPR